MNLKNDITNFQQRFDETFSEACDRFKGLLCKCPHHGFSELHQIDTFYNALTQSDQDSLNAAAGGNILNRTPRDALTIIENKSKVRISRNKPIVSKVSITTSFPSPSPDVTAFTEIIKELVLMNKATQQVTIKSIEDTCVTCGGPHPYYECLATDGNTFNASAATRSYNQGGQGYRPQGETNYRDSNQMRPPIGPSNDFSNYMKTNDVNMRAMQNQISNMKTKLKKEFQTTMLNQNNELKNDLKNMMSSFFQMKSPLGSGSLPSNIIANPRGDLKAITTRSGVSYDGPTIPPTSSPLPKEVEREPEATKDKVQTTSTAHVQLPVVQVPILEPDVAPNPNPKLSIPDGDEQLIFHVDNTLKHPHELINMINFIDITCEDRFSEVLKFKKSNHPSSGSTTSHFDLSLPDYEVFCFKEKSSGSTTSHFNYSLPEYESFCFDHIEEKSSGSTTTHSDYSLPEYDAFYFDDDHIQEKSSGSTTTHSDFALPEYDSFIFNLSIDPFPPANRSTFYHEEFADELALLDPFLPGNEDYNFDPGADLREIEYLLNRDPSIESSPKSDIEIIDPILERFTDEPALILYGDSYKDIDHENSLLALDETFLLDTPPPGSKLVSLEEVENFDPFFSLNRSEMMTMMADIPSLKLNEDKCFDPGGDEIDADIPSDFEDDYYNSEGDIIYLESLLNNVTIPYLPPEVFLEHVPKSLNDEPNIDDLRKYEAYL
ncbi:hypothetical protein Tco_0476309 [Tanacetum coccineum]